MLEKMTSPGKQGADKSNMPPKESWRPHMELDADGGYFVSSPRSKEPADSRELLAEFDLNPEEWIITNVRRSKWQRYDGEWLESFRVSIKPAKDRATLIDASYLEDEIRKWRPSKRTKKSTGDLTFVGAVGDTQWGKDAGGGTSATIDRVMRGMHATHERFNELKGRGIGQIALPQMGDCIEGIVSQGGRITGRIDMPLTSQIRVGRRMLLEWVKLFAPLTDKLIIPVVPGNHDETTRQVLTDPMDSFQVDIVSQVMDIIAENPDMQHVEARFAEPDNSTLAVDLSGVLVGFAHGHQTRNASKWWEGQALGNTPVGQSQILITAHYHHFKVSSLGERLWIQIPSLDGGSAWFRDRSGMDSPPGIVTMVVGDGYDTRRDLAVVS